LEAYDKQGATPLHIAAANGYTNVVQFLLDNNVKLDAKDRDDWRPAHAAACWGHIEVLELLVSAGADLNAKNKHEETPAEICEDPELKDKILQLMVEQNKRIAEQQKKTRVIRRSQSSNTRTQSVRRTSLRDKGMTTRRDAAQEARIRQQGLTLDSSSSHVTTTSPRTSTIVPSNVLDVYERRAPEGRDEQDLSLTNSVEEIEMRNSTGSGNINGNAEKTTFTTDVNGKVTVVHVVVTINGNGTLADLKKQRMQIRNNSSNDVSQYSPVSPISTISGGEISGSGFTSSITAGVSGGIDEGNVLMSPNSEVLKFSTTEVVGAPAEKNRKCCVII